MNPIPLILLSFLLLIGLTVADALIYRLKHPLYMTNRTHVTLYIVPLLISFLLFTIAISQGTFPLVGYIMLLLLVATYILMSSYDKIILAGADMDTTLKMLQQFLEASDRSFRIHQNQPGIATVEIKNYPNALMVRDVDRWVEIDNHLHYDEPLIKSMNEWFKKAAPTMPARGGRPNLFFYVLLAAILFVAAVIIHFYW
ncbi:hypothetical protein ABB02_01886 [Clostridiaceae bacterium JG1575]|nr:hypothetical protein ABB02_01886 [Clostridiaceae bacterium JG1575]